MTITSSIPALEKDAIGDYAPQARLALTLVGDDASGEGSDSNAGRQSDEGSGASHNKP